MCIIDSEERIQNQTRGHKPKEKIGGTKMKQFRFVVENERNEKIEVTEWLDADKYSIYEAESYANICKHTPFNINSWYVEYREV